MNRKSGLDLPMISTARAATTPSSTALFASAGTKTCRRVPGFAKAANLDFPATIAVEYPACAAISITVGYLGYTGSRNGRSLFQVMPCLSGATPVTMLVCDGNVIETAVVFAQKV